MSEPPIKITTGFLGLTLNTYQITAAIAKVKSASHPLNPTTDQRPLFICPMLASLHAMGSHAVAGQPLLMHASAWASVGVRACAHASV